MKKLFLFIFIMFCTFFTANSQSRSFNINKIPLRFQPEIPISNTINTAAFDNALRIRELVINPIVQSNDYIRLNDTILLDLFIDKQFRACIDKIAVDVNGSLTIRAHLVNSSFGYCIISTSNGKSLLSIELPEKNELFLSGYDSLSSKYFLKQIDKSKQKSLEGSLPLVPLIDNQLQNNLKRSKDPDSRNKIPDEKIFEIKKGNNEPDYPVQNGENDPEVVSLMIVYTPAAAAWSEAYEGGINNTISLLMAKAQLALDNSNTLLTIQLVYTGQVSYTEQHSVNDLYNLTNADDGFMDDVHGLRDTYCADVVVLLEETNFTGGVGWLLNTESGLPDYAFSLSRVQQASWTYTTIHEIGHNMGLHHHKLQNFQPGPGLYTYSAGWRWTGTDGGNYCSVMTYEDGSYFADGISHNRVAFFSNPDIQNIGVATGDAVEADNARTLRQTKSVVAAYRSACSGPLDHDVYVSSVDIPSVHNTGSTTPQATVSNLGTNSETFMVTMQIGAYSSTKTVTALEPVTSRQITFDSWVAVAGIATVQVCTELAGDLNPGNDCKTRDIKIVNLNKQVYAYNAYQGSGTDPVGPTTFNLSDPGTLNSLVNQSALSFINGATWAENTWYAVVYGTNEFVKIDPATGNRTVIGIQSVGLNGLSYNTATRTMYGVTDSGLYSVNLATGATTLIGNSGVALLINLAINGAGEAYSVDINSDMLGRIDLATGIFTVIGPVGFNANYAQDMEFDRESGELYMAACSSSGWLAWVNTATGATIKIGNFEGGAEITGLAIPYFIDGPAAFSVTGGGSYCQNSGGMAVGLSGSESGVTYTLYKDNVAQSPTVGGTGSAISFGKQLFGKYTVSGADETHTVAMIGNAVVVEIPILAVSVTIAAAPSGTVNSGTPVTFTATPVNGGSGPVYQWIVNAQNAGTGSQAFTYTPLNNDVITCIMTSSLSCVTGNPATSNSLTVLVKSTSTIARKLPAGWSWFSVNIENAEMNLPLVLNSLTPSDGDYIKNQTASATWYNGYGWFGELTLIDPREMYKIKLASADSLIYEGIPVNPQSRPISINSGWNWIGYLPKSAQPVASCITGINPTVDDYIKNQISSTTYYDGFGWFGELVNLEPLDGYMLKTSNAGFLTYSESDRFTDDRDGKTYKVVKIGDQTWMAENLAYLPVVSPPTSGSSSDPLFYVYGYNETSISSAKATDNYSNYGVLYNWAAALFACPLGWHLPTDEEWKTLEKNQGMSESDADAAGWRFSGSVSEKLKETGISYWKSPNSTATNSSGFTARGGGLRSINGTFMQLLESAGFYTSTADGAINVWCRGMYNFNGLIRNSLYDRAFGQSVRCIKN